MKVLYVILILLALFIVLTLIRAIFFKAKPVKREVFEKENVNSKRVEEHLCDAIRIKRYLTKTRRKPIGQNLTDFTNF